MRTLVGCTVSDNHLINYQVEMGEKSGLIQTMQDECGSLLTASGRLERRVVKCDGAALRAVLVGYSSSSSSSSKAQQPMNLHRILYSSSGSSTRPNKLIVLLNLLLPKRNFHIPPTLYVNMLL